MCLRCPRWWWRRSSSSWGRAIGCFIGLLSSNPLLDKFGVLCYLVFCDAHLQKLVQQALLRGIVYIKRQISLGRWSAQRMKGGSCNW